jgi:L-2-hydroxyglutarate oxidase LhgO
MDGRQEDSIGEIWYVDYNNKYYVMSERLNRAHWVQNIIHNPKIIFSVNEKTFECIARLVDQEKETGAELQI